MRFVLCVSLCGVWCVVWVNSGFSVRGHSCERRWGSKLRFHGGVGLPTSAAQRSGTSGWEWTWLEKISRYGPEFGELLLVLTGVGRTTRVCVKCAMWSDHVFRRRMWAAGTWAGARTASERPRALSIVCVSRASEGARRLSEGGCVEPHAQGA